MEALLENERWVMRLARALVRDDDEANDIVQQARVAFWQRPPRDRASLRSWLGTIVRNLVRNRARDAARHETILTSLGGENARDPSPDAILERLQTHRMLGDLVASLDEPFRQTVLLRYYEGLSAADIARQTGVPAGTVRWRLKTALARLRSRLDERHGGRAAWMALLMPFPTKLSPGGVPRTVGLARPWLYGLFAAAAALLPLSLHWDAFGTRRSNTPRAAVAEVSRPVDPGVGHRAALRPTIAHPMVPPSVTEGPAVPAPQSIPEWAIVGGLEPRAIEGRVTSNGKPVAGAEVRLLSGMMPFRPGFEQRLRTGAGGRFAFPNQPATNFILTVLAGELRPEMVYVDLRSPPKPGEGNNKQVDVTLDRCTSRVHGAVLDNEGTPLPHAHIIAGAEAGRGGHEVDTDARGVYQVCIPGWRGNPARRTLLARADGYAAAEVLAPDASRRVDFSLSPEAVVSGRVVAPPDNSPVPGALVSMTPARYQPATEMPRSTEFLLMTDDPHALQLPHRWSQGRWRPPRPPTGGPG